MDHHVCPSSAVPQREKEGSRVKMDRSLKGFQEVIIFFHLLYTKRNLSFQHCGHLYIVITFPSLLTSPLHQDLYIYLFWQSTAFLEYEANTRPSFVDGGGEKKKKKRADTL